MLHALKAYIECRSVIIIIIILKIILDDKTFPFTKETITQNYRPKQKSLKNILWIAAQYHPFERLLKSYLFIKRVARKYHQITDLYLLLAQTTKGGMRFLL